MKLARRNVALFGRFSTGARDHLVGLIDKEGGRAQRDLMRGGDLLVVGAGALPLIDTGALLQRLAEARRRKLPVFGEAGFRAWLEQDLGSTATFPMTAALTQSGLDRESADLLAAFDLAQIRNDTCRFGDVRVFATAAELIAAGCLPSRTIRILLEARTLAPLGRHKVVLDGHGAPALQWEDGITTLDGQRFLPLPVENDPAEDLFEDAMAAEAEGEFDEAARLYEAAAQADRSDGISLYNCGTIRLRQGRHDEAIAAYRASLKRDPQLIESHYNLAQVFEAKGDMAAAVKCLEAALAVDAEYSDALFNLAQLKLGADDLRGAAQLFERYLRCDDVSTEWQAKARRALAFCRTKSRMA